jgi:DNA-binding HxlR family transcriptional regulator
MQVSTSSDKVVTTRSYRQYCGVARALDIVGERWALLIVRELVLGPKRFTDLRHGLPGIATNVLTQRLKEMERDGIIARRVLPPPAASTVYELTEYGREFEPIMLRLGAWGAKTLGERPPGFTLNGEWLMVAMKAMFQPEAATGVEATIGIVFEDGAFTVRLGDGSLDVEPGRPANPDLTLKTDADTLFGYLVGAPVPAAALSPEGHLALLARLPGIFAFAG